MWTFALDVSWALLLVEMEGLVTMTVIVMLNLLRERMLALLMRPLCSDLNRKERLSMRLE